MTLFVANKRRRAFTLVEMMLVVAMMGLILTTVFEVLGNVGVTSARITSRVDANKDVYYAIEKLSTFIKEGGKIDFEEYWNRSAFSTGYNLINGHYAPVTGFGNYGYTGVLGTGSFGREPYVCRSLASGAMTGYPAVIMGIGYLGCMDGDGFSSDTYGVYYFNPKNTLQRYGEYRLQFIDYNSDASSENVSMSNPSWGDEDGNLTIIGDDDDADIGTGPAAFSGTVFASGARELYLIKKFPQYERTYFRYSVKQDPFLTGGTWSCDVTTGSGNACLGNVQMLKLVGKDFGYDHSGIGLGANDGKIDTWICAPGFHCFQTIMGGKYEIPTGSDAEWIDLFPDYVNVRRLEFYPWPNKEGRYAWREANPSLTMSPYVRIRITMAQSGQQRLLNKKSASAEQSYSTTIALSDF